MTAGHNALLLISVCLLNVTIASDIMNSLSSGDPADVINVKCGDGDAKADRVVVHLQLLDSQCKELSNENVSLALNGSKCTGSGRVEDGGWVSVQLPALTSEQQLCASTDSSPPTCVQVTPTSNDGLATLVMKTPEARTRVRRSVNWKRMRQNQGWKESPITWLRKRQPEVTDDRVGDLQLQTLLALVDQQAHAVSKRSADDDVTEDDVEGEEEVKCASSPVVVSRNHIQKRSWAEGDIDWMKRGDTNKRPWGETSMEWLRKRPWSSRDDMKRETERPWYQRLSSYKRPWDDSVLQYMKRTADKRPWDGGDMAWLKRSDDEKRPWEGGVLDYVKRNSTAKRAWDDVMDYL